jgi:hypothetical protein
LHSAVYLAGKQPARTLAFIAAGLVTIALLAEDIWLIARDPAGH